MIKSNILQHELALPPDVIEIKKGFSDYLYHPRTGEQEKQKKWGKKGLLLT